MRSCLLPTIYTAMYMSHRPEAAVILMKTEVKHNAGTNGRKTTKRSEAYSR